MKRIMLFAVLLFVLPTIGHGQGAVSIDQVNTLVSEYAIRQGEPARFVMRLNNTTGQRCNVSNGFKISSPDGAVWDSVTVDSAGLNISGENQFAGYFDIAYALWGGVTMQGDGSNPDTVGVLAAGNLSRTTRMMPVDYNDTAVAVVVWMHELVLAGKHICIDTAFWGVGGTWVWVGSNLVDYFPTLNGLPGQPYSNGSGVNRDGSGFCFEITNIIPPAFDTVHVPADYATIQEAVKAVNANGVVLVSPGTYIGGVSVSGKQVHIKSTDGPLVTTLTGASNHVLVTYFGSTANGSILEGFRVSGGSVGVLSIDAGPIIRRNIFDHQNITNGPAIALTEAASAAIVENNTIYGCAGGGIETSASIAPIIRNNIIFDNATYGIKRLMEVLPIALSYNDIFGNPEGNPNITDFGPGALSIDPLLDSIGQLTDNSPCIDAGDPASIFNDPDGTRNDMGAVPFGSDIPPGFDTVHVPADYATIQGAVDAVNTNGVVLVSPGTYTESVTISGKKVDIISTDGALSTVMTNSDGTDLVTFIGPETNGSLLEGFTLQGGRIGVWCQDAAPIIRHNLLRSQRATSWAAIALSGIGWGTIGQSPAQIINNTIFGNTGGGISTFSTVAPTIKNTIIANNVKYGIHVQDDMNPQIALSYNDVYGNPVAYYNVPDPGTGTITSDPLFAGDFTLQEFSPCINAGDPSPMYNDPDGSRNDMGAFPFDGSVEPPTGDTLRVPQQYPTIQAAIDAAHNGQVVLVDRGSYTGGINFMGKLIKVTSVDGPQFTRIIPLITPDTVVQFNLVTFDHGENSQAVLEGFRLLEGNIGVYIRNSGPTIRRNIFERQQVRSWAAIALADGPAPAIIENNTITGCANGGISTFSTIAPIIRNNIIYNNAAYGIHKQSVALPIALSYNDIYGNPDGNYNISDFGPGAISLDPQLDMFGELTATSPCINAGDPNPIFNDPDGSRNDMGALPFGGSGPSGLMNLVQWRAADGGNDHWYAVIPEKLYWIEADAKAKTFAKDGIPGHLATISSPFENQFIVDHVLMGADQDNRFDNFFIGGRDMGGQWRWITGEPWGYTNWASGEPNNVGIETALCMYGHYDTYSHAIPGTWNNSLPDGTVNQLHQYWSVVEFGVGDTVVVDDPIPTNEWISLFCAAPHLDGVPLLPGAVIRAFDPQGVLCGKTTVKSDGSFGFMLVYRDDPYTSRDEGAVPGDKIGFRINNEVATVSPAVYWTQNGDQFQACAFERNACITLHLQQGWNLISWNVGWASAPRDLLTPIINCVEFVLGFDQGGLVYDPQLERFSTLSQVDYLHGYWVKMSCAADLEVCGNQLHLSTVIPVDPGWNLVSYLPMTTMSPSAGFLTINANLQVAIGYVNGAKIYVPTNPSFNTLTILEPGAGYWLRMSAADVLEYGFMPADGTDPHLPSSLATSNGGQLGSRVWMSLYGEEITVDGLPLADKSSIEVYSPAGELVGRGLYTDKLLKFIPVYGYDGDEGSARLARANDQLTLKVNGKDVSERVIWTGEGTTYRLASLTTTSLPSTYSLAQNYPNPFNPATTIAFAVPKHQYVRIVVFNLLGQEIRTLTDDEYDAGQYEVVWDGRDRGGDLVPTGLYFYRMESGEVNLTRKMMLLK